MLQSPLGLDSVRNRIRNSEISYLIPLNILGIIGQVFSYSVISVFLGFRLWNMPRRFQDQRLSSQSNQSRRWKRLCPSPQGDPACPHSHPWNLCGTGTRRRRNSWLLSKPFISYRGLGNLKDRGKNAWTGWFSAVTVAPWFPSPLKFQLAWV